MSCPRMRRNAGFSGSYRQPGAFRGTRRAACFSVHDRIHADSAVNRRSRCSSWFHVASPWFAAYPAYRSTLVRFGAGSIISFVQSIAFFAELGPLPAGLLVAGRVGAGIGAQRVASGRRDHRGGVLYVRFAGQAVCGFAKMRRLGAPLPGSPL